MQIFIRNFDKQESYENNIRNIIKYSMYIPMQME